MKQAKLWLPVLCVVLLIPLVRAGAAPLPKTAATPAQPGIAITPAIQDRVLGPTEKSASFSAELTNQTDKPITFSLSTNDFTSLNQTGGLNFQGSDIGRVTNGHGLSSIIKLDSRLVTIPPKGTHKISATIDDVGRLALGGHYTAILAQALPDEAGSKGNKVSLNQVVSSLLFLETAGQGTKTLKLLNPPLSKLSFNLPNTANLVFKATGNTQTIPRGIVTIDHGRQEIGRGVINENSSLLLPGSTRLLPTPISGNKHPWWFGKYTLRVQYRYEGSLGVSMYQKSFLYFNVKAFLLTLLIAIVGLYTVWRTHKTWIPLLKKLDKRMQPPKQRRTRRIIIISDKSHAGEVVKVTRRVNKH